MHKLSFSFRRGFNLIEAAIVLGVVGLVIGGIWVAAASVHNNHKYSRIQADVLSMAINAARLFPVSQYPTVDYDQTDITQAAYRAGIIPASYNIINLSSLSVQAFVTPEGFTGTLFLARLPTRPVIAISLYTDQLSGVSAGMSPADCLQIVARYAMAKNTSIPEVWISKTGTPRFAVLTLPIDISTFTKCPLATTAVTMLYNP